MKILNVLFEITIYSAVIFFAIMLIKLLLKNSMSPFLHLAIWSLLIARLLIPATFESSLRLFTIPAETVSETAQEQIQPTVSGPDIITDNTYNIAEPQTKTEPQQTQTAAAQAAVPAAKSSLSTEQIILAVWLTGFGIGVLYLAALYGLLLRRIHKNAHSPSERLLEMFAEVKAELNIKRNVRVIGQCEYGTPAVLFPATVLMPINTLVSMSDDEVKFVLRHELTHIRRFDHIFGLFLSFLNAVYWFNPVVWAAVRQIRADMETACDSDVVRYFSGHEKSAYAAVILSLFSRKQYGTPALGMVNGNTRKIAEKRIKGVFMRRRTNKKAKITAALLAALLLFTCFTTACQPTPKTQIVVNKGNGAINSAVRQTAQVKAAYKAPATLKYSKKIENVNVDIDAQVSAPDASSFGVYKVKLHDVQQDEADKYIKALLGNGPYYDAGSTKEIYDEMIIRTKQSISDIQNMADDKFKKIYDANETKASVIASLNGEINDYTIKREAAPSKNDRRPADTKFVQNKDNKIESDVQLFTETDKGVAKVSINKFTNYPNTMYTYELDAKSSELTISEQQARSFASEFLKKLNLQDEYSIYNSQAVSSNIFMIKSGPIFNHPESLNGNYYVFDFTRVRGGVTTNVIDGMPAMVTDATNVKPKADGAYSYFPEQERMQMMVNDSGVISFYWKNNDDSVETTNQNASLLPFEKIQDIIEESSVYSKFFAPREKNAELKVTAIELGDMRVKSPDEQDRYIMVPVWDVIGKKVSSGSDSSKKSEMPDMSVLTINALDGSIIDRNKGY